jgi:hypothetical protein
MVFLQAKALIFQSRAAAGHFGCSHSLRMTRRLVLPGGTRKSFELILEFDFSVMPASLFVSVYLWGSVF